MVRIVRTRDRCVDSTIQALVSDWQPVHGVPRDEHRRQLPCPACGGIMSLVNYANDSGIFVDRCNGCDGLWLDQLELEKVQALLERWASEAPAQITALARQLEDARLAARRAARFDYRSSRFSFVNALLSRLLDAA
jgi:Zn-finger nucleic acid-binding protein